MTYHCREGAHFSHGKHELKLRTKKHLRPATGASATSNLHEECAKYPETLRSVFAHPWHNLKLSRTDGLRLSVRQDFL
jgi:hypothetical protein